MHLNVYAIVSAVLVSNRVYVYVYVFGAQSIASDVHSLVIHKLVRFLRQSKTTHKTGARPYAIAEI